MPALNWQIEPGQLWAIVGENGCGKTTLIQSILGLTALQSGQVLCPVTKRYIAQVDHSERETPQRVIDYVTRGLYNGRNVWIPLYAYLHRNAIKDNIASLELGPVQRKQYAALSEGMKQRAKLAQALVSSPKLIFLDESTSAMDPRHTQKYYTILQAYLTSAQASCVVVTHHFQEILPYLTHALVFCERQYVMGPISEVMNNTQACAVLKRGN